MTSAAVDASRGTVCGRQGVSEHSECSSPGAGAYRAHGRSHRTEGIAGDGALSDEHGKAICTGSQTTTIIIFIALGKTKGMGVEYYKERGTTLGDVLGVADRWKPVRGVPASHPPRKWVES